MQWQAVEARPDSGHRPDAGADADERTGALADGSGTIDVDTTELEVYGRKKRGVAFKASGSAGRPHVAPRPRPRWCCPPTWATALMTRRRPRRGQHRGTQAAISGRRCRSSRCGKIAWNFAAS